MRMVKRMKKILISLIHFYQKMPLSSHSKCRFTPTCSEYAIESIETYGSLKGSFLAIKRILRCHPFGGYGFDPVPKKEMSMKKVKSGISPPIALFNISTSFFISGFSQH